MRFFKTVQNLFGSDKNFFDKEATIKEYFDLVPEQDRKEVSSYEELYEEALKVVEKQDFEENVQEQGDYFHILTGNESTIAVLIGILAFAVSREVDEHGTDLEKAIDRVLPKGYDTNNPFDVKEGLGHRIFGHDPALFGLKNIPADMPIKVKIEDGKRSVIKIGEFLGVGTDGKVSMWDLIWKFYGNNDNKISGVVNCLKHTIVHFAKDLLTPAGLPLPLTTLFEKYKYYENLNAHGIMYKNSLMQKLDNMGIKMKASDFAAFFLIETFLAIYCKANNMDVSSKRDMKLIAMGTCISMQMAVIALSKELHIGKKGTPKMTAGGKLNPILSLAFLKLTFQEMNSVYKARKDVNRNYDKIGKEVATE
ncbi:hypothetical protein SAMN02910265_02415 [Ruminococcus flavefaciens]|uniref:Uncharacterized protein n=1 Tax=Ruminococcus flavefaciens TaxID=1265 RepID=A0A1H6KL61_RUMFL|nr:hypothetical protein [Ruminococcus flavefaciens]SEH74131.1 hypothetical protein SAMN02910265_02415 [Ruminococcus flavefaciens]